MTADKDICGGSGGGDTQGQDGGLAGNSGAGGVVGSVIFVGGACGGKGSSRPLILNAIVCRRVARGKMPALQKKCDIVETMLRVCTHAHARAHTRAPRTRRGRRVGGRGSSGIPPNNYPIE
jgi:hypothetical protein